MILNIKPFTLDTVADQLKPLERFAKEHKGMIGTAVALTVFCRIIYKARAGPPKKFKNLPYLSTWDMLKSMWEGNSFQEHFQKYVEPLLEKGNGMYVQQLFLGWQIRSSDPKVNKIFMSDMVLFPKFIDLFGTKPTMVHKLLGGHHIGTLEGEEWRRHRKVVNPAFHRALPVELFGRLTAKTFGYMEKTGESNVDVLELCSRMTLDAIGIAGFGFDFEASSDVNSEWALRYSSITRSMMSTFYALFDIFDVELLFLSPSRVKAHKELDRLLEKIDEMIDIKREEIAKNIQLPSYKEIPDSQKDILTLMVEAELQGEGALSNYELRRNIAGFFVAGHDTTSSALAAALGHLARKPEIQQKARQEVLQILGDESEDVHPSPQDIKNMPYLDAIIKETLRMNPPISNTLARQVSKDTVINGVLIKEGTFVDVDTVATHLSSQNWENPMEFMPERFLGTEDPTSAKEGISWIPFGHGSHLCIGMNFSIAEQRVFLSMFLRKYEWSLPEDTIHHDYIVAESMGQIKPRDLYINFTKRY